MSEHTGNTQPIKPVKPDDTQPIQPIKKRSRWISILIGFLGFVLLVGLGGYSGYSAGIGDRKDAANSVISKQLAEQYAFALVDIQFGRYDAAKQRLEFIIANDPNYPGVQEKLTEVLVLSSIPTVTATPSLTPTPDFSGRESAFGRAQQLIAAQDWPNALVALDTVRKMDPAYNTAQVDGMYYFALRNYGYDLITKQGNLEGGIYQLTLAERFGPLDNSAIGLREAARLYITGASFWELDWRQAVSYFSQVGSGWPSMYDGSMTAGQRLNVASMRYGDELFENQDYCAAYDQYQVALSYGNLDEKAANHSNHSYQECYPPTATPEIIIPTETPTIGP